MGAVSDFDLYVEHKKLFYAQSEYCIHRVLRHLRQQGFVCRVLDRFDADDTGRVAMLHADLTQIPDWCRDIHKYYEVCINGRATTISRLLFSRVTLEPDTEYEGPVITKSIYNSRGLPELRYREATHLPSRIKGWIGRRFRSNYNARQCPPYRVFASPSKVPKRIWEDPTRIVEEFIPGTLQTPITTFRYQFFFDEFCNERMTCDSLIARDETFIENAFLDDVADELLTARREFNVDFGAIDYLMRDGKPVIIDINKTLVVPETWLVDDLIYVEHIDRIIMRFERLVAESGR